MTLKPVQSCVWCVVSHRSGPLPIWVAGIGPFERRFPSSSCFVLSCVVIPVRVRRYESPSKRIIRPWCMSRSVIVCVQLVVK